MEKRADHHVRAGDDQVIGNPKPEVHVEFGGVQNVGHQDLIVIHAQRPCAPVDMRFNVQPRLGLHGRAQIDCRAHDIGESQRARLERHLDEFR